MNSSIKRAFICASVLLFSLTGCTTGSAKDSDHNEVESVSSSSSSELSADAAIEDATATPEQLASAVAPHMDFFQAMPAVAMCAVGWVIPDQMEMTELDQIDCYDDFKEYVARAEEMSSELSELAAPVSMADLHEETVSLFGAYGRLPILESCGEEFPAFEDSACQEVISAMNTSFSTTSEFLDRWQPYI